MEKSGYDELYKEKNKYPIGPLNIVRNNLILREIPKKGSKAILDIGCGRGFLDIELGKKGYHVTGVDFSEEAVNFAKKLSEQNNLSKTVNFIVGDLFKLVFDKQFDIVICSEVVEHIEDDKSAVKKLASFLNDSGILIITVPYSMRQWNKDDDRSGHFKRYYIKDMAEILQNAGLGVGRVFVWGFPLMRIYRFLYRQTYSYSSEEENKPLGYVPKGKLMRLYHKCLPLIIKVFDIDNVFNFTRQGIDLVVVAKKSRDNLQT